MPLIVYLTLLIILGSIIYPIFHIKRIKKIKNNGFTIKVKYDLADYPQHRDWFDSVEINDELNIWLHPEINGEIRLYAKGSETGDGLIFSFISKRLYKMIRKRNPDFTATAKTKSKNKLIIEFNPIK